MSTYLSRLNPSERRFVVGVGVAVFVVVNILLVWPHFSDWTNVKHRLETALGAFQSHQKAIDKADKLQPELDRLQSSGAAVPQEDQATEFLLNIQSQAAASGVAIIGSNPRQVGQTSPFFVEQIQTIPFQAAEKNLVDFLYNLGSSESMIRVRDMSLHPDQTHMQLAGNITLVASFKKKATGPAPKPAAATTQGAKPGPSQAQAAKPAATPQSHGPIGRTLPQTNAPGAKPTSKK